MDQNKRKLLSLGLKLAGLSSGAAVGTALSQVNKLTDKKHSTATMRRIEEQEAKQVELLYSTKPKRIILANREYRIPSNFFGPKERDEPNTCDANERGFGFYLFLPDCSGYTRENWRDPFDARLITVVNVRTVDKKAMVPMTDGKLQPIRPEGYGEPRAAFRNYRALLESNPTYRAYGLDGYRLKNAGPESSVTWVGTRSNGEFFFFDSTLPPDVPAPSGSYPSCQVRYYSEQEDLHVVYRYAEANLDKWREIDDAIWIKLKTWRVK
jgi:hypothetical protein